MLTIRNVYCQQGKCLERSIKRPVLFEVNWSRGQAIHAVATYNGMLYSINCQMNNCMATLTTVNRNITKATPQLPEVPRPSNMLVG